MRERTKTEAGGREEHDLLTEVLRAGARKLTVQALEAEITDFFATYAVYRSRFSGQSSVLFQPNFFLVATVGDRSS